MQEKKALPKTQKRNERGGGERREQESAGTGVKEWGHSHDQK